MAQISLDLETPAWAEPLLQPARYKGAKGGRSSGKSHFFAELAVEEMVVDPSLRFVCIREVQRSLKFSAKSLIEKKIREMGVSHLFTILEREIRRNGGTGLMIFEGMQDHTADSLKSLEGFGRAWVEEAQNLSKRSLELLLPTIRAEGSEIWFSWNPDQPDDPVDLLLVENRPAGAVVVHVNYLDNPFCPEVSKEEARRIEAVDPDAYSHIWLGGYNTRSVAQVLSGMWVVDEFEPADDWDGPYHGADFGFAQDPTTLIRSWINGRKLMVEYESYAVGLELDHTPDRWKRDVPGCERYVIRAESARPESISYLSRHGIPRIVAVTKWPGSVEDGIAHLRQYDKIVIHRRCTHTIDEARLYSYKVDKRTGDVLPEIVDAHNHCLVASTLVDTSQGQKAISELVGHTGFALTLEGWKRFHDVRCTSEREPVYTVNVGGGVSFTGTPDHPVLTDRGWLPILALRRGMRIIRADTLRYAMPTETPCHPNMCSSTVGDTAATIVQGITGAPTPMGKHLSTCIGKCGDSTMGRSPKGTKSITRIKTRRPLTRRGYSACPAANTPSYTDLNSLQSAASGRGTMLSLTLSLPPARGTHPTRVALGTLSRLRRVYRCASTHSLATNAVKISRSGGVSHRLAFAQMLANPLGDGRPARITFNGNALVVSPPSPFQSTAGRSVADASAGNDSGGAAVIEGVSFAGYAPVYNMEVEEVHHFAVEGGLIVHNCIDPLRYSLVPLMQARVAPPRRRSVTVGW